MNDGINQVLKELERRLAIIAEEYDCPLEACGVRRLPTGILTIEVRDTPILYFFDENNLVDWITDAVEYNTA